MVEKKKEERKERIDEVATVCIGKWFAKFPVRVEMPPGDPPPTSARVTIPLPRPVTNGNVTCTAVVVRKDELVGLVLSRTGRRRFGMKEHHVMRSACTVYGDPPLIRRLMM